MTSGSARSPRETGLEQVMTFLAGVFRRPEPAVDAPDVARDCARDVAGNERLSPAEQVDIGRQFWLRHVDSLVEDYPGLRYVIGEDAFDAFCRAYLEAHPPRTPSLRDLGEDIVAFAETWPSFPPERRRLCLDMIAYENACIDVFDGADAAPIASETIAALPPEAWERARIVLQPTLVPMRLAHPVARIRLALRSGESPALPEREAPTLLVVFRKDFTIHFEELAPDAFALLEALRGGASLVRACERISEGKDAGAIAELEANVARWFREWSAWGWIVGVEV